MTSDTRPDLAPDRDVVNGVELRSADLNRAEDGPRSLGRNWWPIFVCIGVYGALAMLDFDPLSPFGSGHMVDLRSADQISQLWWIEWAYQALAHGQNPLFTSWQNDPVGINAGVNGSMLVLGALASPITFLFGPVVSWNVLERAAPFASALSMCLVLRRWTTWWPAAFVGGLLYGFSSYVLTQGGHLFLAFVPLPPIFFLLLHEALVRQRWNPVRSGALLGLVCAAQFFIFSEVFASMVIMGVGAAALYLLANRRQLSVAKLYLRKYCVAAAVVGGALLVYPIFFTLLGPQHINGVPNPPANLAALHGDLLGLVVPGYFDRLAVPTLQSYYLLAAATMYLGIPLLVAVGVTVFFLRRSGIVQMAGAMTVISLILSLGSTLYVGGHDTHLPLPFVVMAHLPLTQGFLASRFSLYTILFGSAIIAIGLDALHRHLVVSRRLDGLTRRRRDLVVLGVAMSTALVVGIPMLPLGQQSSSATSVSPLFSSLEASRNIPEGSALLAYPYPDNPSYPGTYLGFSYSSRYQSVNDVLLDQAISGMHFRLIGGYGWRPSGAEYGTPSPSRLLPDSVKDLFDFAFYGVATRSGESKVLVTSDLVADLRAFVRAHNVDTVVVLHLGQHPTTVARFLTAAIGEPSHVEGALVWFDVKHRLKTVAPGHHMSLLVAPPVTAVVSPIANEKWEGAHYLAASASADLGVDKVVFRITGEGRTVVESARKSLYGWLARWDTATVTDGPYTVQSVAYGASGQVATSAGVIVQVRNG